MANVIRHQKFSSVDAGYAAKSDNDKLKGSNKVWECKVYDNGDYEAFFGKMNGTMTRDFKQLGSVAAANAYADKKIAEKKKSKTDKKTGMVTCYEEVNTIDTEGFQPQASVGKREIGDIAKKQISYSNPIVADLIDRLSRVNIHDILMATGGKMTYNDTTGLFSTPLGVVTQDSIDEARDILVEIGGFVAANDFENESLIKDVERFMRRIPTDTGYGKLTVRSVFPDLDAVQKQSSILDSLQASLQIALAPPVSKKKVAEEPKIFDVQLDLIEDGKKMDELRALYKRTRKDQHVCSHLDVKRAFTVDIKTMREAFEPVSGRLGNIKQLWHGTRTANLLSILKGGLVIPPANAGFCTGRMYGNGVYFAIHSTKSLNYAYGYWNGVREENCFMFLADVALGNYCVPQRSGNNYPLPGYDSTWAQSGKSGVINDEIIVPRINQCNLTYLLEFSPGGK